MAILVTGGAGYIGRIVVEDLLMSCGETIVLDNLSRSARNYELMQNWSFESQPHNCSFEIAMGVGLEN